jgi:uncharacterized protein (TIGR03000 family)
MLSVGAPPALAQRGPYPGGSFNPPRPPITSPTSTEYYRLHPYYAPTYPYNTASETFAGGIPADYYYGYMLGAMSSITPRRYSAGAEDSYGADVYALLRESPRPPAAAAVQRSLYAPSPVTNEATILVRLPDPEARVAFDDTPTRQTGEVRTFRSPPLDPAKTYTYTVRATWMENGREVTRSKDVKVEAGQGATVDFREPRKTPDK